MLRIDGSQGEGGGQVVRSSLTLALLTGQAIRIERIRAGRSKPGLQPQHVMCVKAAAAISGATYKGATVGSDQLFFEPREVRPGAYTFPIGTAGAAALVLQTVYLPLALRGHQASELVIEGGTHVPHSPCFHFLQTTWASYLRLMGLEIELEMPRAGFYPRGGGQIRARIQPARRVKPLILRDCPALSTAVVLSAVAGGLPESIAQRQGRRLMQCLKREGIETHLRLERWDALSPGTFAAVTFLQAPVPTLVFSLGERGKPAETVAEEAAEQAIRYRQAQCPVDAHSADQILLPLAFADGPSEYRLSELTRHLTTQVALLQQFCDRKIVWEGSEGLPATLRIS